MIDDPPVGTSFIRLLIGDVVACQERVAGLGDAASKRSLVRASFAAIEGALWITREHVVAIASSMELLTPLTAMALREQTYTVTDRGVVVEQKQFTTLRTSLRLLTAQATLIEPALQVRFDHHGWQALQAAVEIRNRLTHPKQPIDLTLADDDLANITAGLRWFLATIEYLMAATTRAYRSWVDAHSAVMDALIAGDPDIVSAYREAVEQLSEAG